jgi:syntaxin 18
MDVTAAFRSAASTAALDRRAAASPARADQLVASAPLPAPSARSPVLKSAHDTLALVGELRAFVARHRGAYLREDADADATRDGIESEVRLSVEACQAHVDMLRSVVTRRAAAETDPPQAVAHLHGVVLIVTERLAAVAAGFDACREVRFRKVLAEAERKRLRAPPRVGAPSLAAEPGSSASDAPPPPGTATEEPSRRQTQTQLETTGGGSDDLLMEELTGTLSRVKAAERSVLEMSALSSLFAGHVQRQMAQIETLYAEAVESTRRIEGGNVELRKTLERRGEGRKIVAVILFVATFGLLFLDWMSG